VIFIRSQINAVLPYEVLRLFKFLHSCTVNMSHQLNTDGILILIHETLIAKLFLEPQYRLTEKITEYRKSKMLKLRRLTALKRDIKILMGFHST